MGVVKEIVSSTRQMISLYDTVLHRFKLGLGRNGVFVPIKSFEIIKPL